ncbi:hypothetical protein NQ315_012541 [Exocentrus adspersus]|uniref:Uncharacterized protein n=1 Tax=Exocentrus adspersus TaxID=1586481 RepID=A0AAV8VC64_9CUCU|nr:hypothetical protein NQ315_012541 [Exocentrus adspersus]
MDNQHTYLEFTIKLLNIVNLWPHKDKQCGFIKTYFILGLVLLSILALMADFVLQFYGTLIVMTITMLVCGILIHVSANLNYLKSKIQNLSNIPSDNIMEHVNFCVKYHTAICDFSDQINEAFSTMMLVHITWTSFIISVLGFEIIMDTNFSNSVRFSLHLGGWLGMLFLICFYGQILMDDVSTQRKDNKR